MEHEQVLLSVRDAAEKLGVSRGTAYRLIEDEGLPAVKLRGLMRVPAGALDEWIRRQEQRALGAAS